MGNSHKKFTASIDAGTSFTKMAFVESELLAKNPMGGGVYVYGEWPDQNGRMCSQTPSTVLIQKDEGTSEFSIKEYGYEAEEKFKLLNDKEKQSHLLFKNFKRTLHSLGNFTEDLVCATAIDGRTIPLTFFLSLVFKYLAKKLREYIHRTFGLKEDIDKINDDIQWVFPVPAIWKTKPRAIMRKALKEAGLCSAGDIEQVALVLEPDCAAMSVRHSTLLGKGGKSVESYLVIDCGGGTIDMAYHESTLKGWFTTSYNISDVSRPSGGPWGGAYIDDHFKELLGEVFGKECIKHLSPATMAKVMEAFEAAKTLNKDNKKIIVQLPYEFKARVEEFFHEPIDKIVSGYSKKRPRYVRVDIADDTACNLQIIEDGFQFVMGANVDKIKAHATMKLSEDRERQCDHVILVGQYSNAILVKEAIEQVLKDFGINNFVQPPLFSQPCTPTTANAISIGALHIGCNQEFVRRFKPVHSYVICTFRYYDGDKDSKAPPEEITKVNERKMRLHDYNQFIKLGKVRNTKEKWSKTFSSLQSDNGRVKFYIYRSEEKSIDSTFPKRINADSPAGILDVPFDKKIEVMIKYKGEELLAYTKDGSWCTVNPFPPYD